MLLHRQRRSVSSGHAVAESPPGLDNSDWTNTDVLIGHSENKSTFTMKHFLGKVFKMPTFRTEGNKKVLCVDAAFAIYPTPHTASCAKTWSSDGESFCLDANRDNYLERLVPLTVRGGDNKVYNVVGSKEPTSGLAVRVSGSVSGVPKDSTVEERVLSSVRDTDYYRYSYRALGDITVVGDSGSPVYTMPSAVGDVYIVGVLSGSFYRGGKQVGVAFSPGVTLNKNLT